ncbi:hypothetical protein PpBr36_02609 [Pyricularia pennisetigena]|uniref:hypothetical protein n=1 Tax=Pyricularia pennisetigena TaxID=1578925 RepID=UPI00114EF7B1|nr:hypothetical protein PpBr36_02609 [Pyricularia pennisetigena]TLS31066.1 hypothetical protein PpBr36_02609 [Pyricularia pennisetigena]
MRSILFVLLLAPAAVLSIDIIVGKPTTGNQCCNKGTPDESDTCGKQGLNSYCCCHKRNDEKGGCQGPEGIEGYPDGRTVLSFATGGCHTVNSVGDNLIGFIGCAK